MHPQSHWFWIAPFIGPGTVFIYATRSSTLACMLSPQSHCSRASKVEAVLLSSRIASRILITPRYITTHQRSLAGAAKLAVFVALL